LSPKSVVVCDDQPSLVALLKHLLLKRGYEVRTAADGVEGLEIVKDERPAVMLLDLAMPNLDGLGVLRALRSLGGRPPYTLVLTAQEDEIKTREALSLGAAEVWKKPFNAADLLTRLDALVARAAA
jgi:DNA-binding response OmpR family regulator